MEDCCWERLGIDPTADTTVIKKAYAKQLKFNKPDKNPEGFRDLRAAYEQALNESYWYEEEEDFVETDLVETDLVEAGSIETRFTEEEFLAATDITNIAPVEHPAEDYNPIHWYYNGAGINAAHENAENEDDDENEEDFDNTEEPFFLFEPSPWVQTWEQAIEETDATSDNGDEHLQALLQSQLNTPRSLDEQKDFEEALLVWLAEKPPVLTLSYQLAKTYFRWDQRLEHWSRNDYPWYMLDSLDERYQHVSYFQSPAAFRGFLSHRFPTVASYFPLENPHDIENNAEETREPLKIKFSYIFRRLFFPFRVIELAQELKTLDAELDYYIHDHPAASELGGTNTDNNNGTFNARYWQQESPLKTLNDWILKRFIEFEDFGLIALIVAVVLTMFSLFSQKPWLSFYYDGIGVFVVISLYYLFWQLQLRLFATPEKFVSYGPWTTGWRNASALLFVLGYISWLDISKLDSIGMPTSPVYFLTHFAGASLFAANSIRQRNIIVTAISWHAGVLILVLAVLIPVFVIVVEQPSYPIPGVFPISPLFWLLLATPAFLISLSESYPRLEWLDNVGGKLLAMGHWLMLIGGFILLTYCADILLKMDFGFTGIAITLTAITMTLSIAVILNAFKEED